MFRFESRGLFVVIAARPAGPSRLSRPTVSGALAAGLAISTALSLALLLSHASHHEGKGKKLAVGELLVIVPVETLQHPGRDLKEHGLDLLFVEIGATGLLGPVRPVGSRRSIGTVGSLLLALAARVLWAAGPVRSLGTIRTFRLAGARSVRLCAMAAVTHDANDSNEFISHESRVTVLIQVLEHLGYRLLC